jgi:nucleoid-associated protein YgaU
MGLFTFLKEAGQKLFGKEVKAAEQAAAADPAKKAEVDRAAATAIENYVQTLGLKITDDQANKEKAILAAGNVEGVSGVDDQMTVAVAAPQAKFYTVVKGDTLSKIAKEFYGNANEYMRIFEANKPMLTDPDKIYPGQNLRIPPK